MKNIVKILTLVAIVSFVSSCKTHEKCPAFGKYGKVDTQKASIKPLANS